MARGWATIRRASICKPSTRVPNWSKVPAIAAKRVHILPESLFTYPGPRLIEGLELLINRFAAY